MKDRYGPWAVVVGASSGIGQALAGQLLAGGYGVLLVARSLPSLEATAERLRASHGGEVRVVAADMADPAGVQSLIDATEDLEVGVFIPCAAVEHSGYFVDRDLETHQRMLQINCAAPMVLAHHYGARMASRGRGAILFVSSLSGWNAQPYMAHYGASKAYILSLGEALHHEMKDKGVHVSVLSPGPTDTPMAAGTGIDFASMGMAIMTPASVAATGLAALGHRQNAIPGLRNQMMAFMMTRLMPRAWAGAMFRMMMGKALGIGRAVA